MHEYWTLMPLPKTIKETLCNTLNININHGIVQTINIKDLKIFTIAYIRYIKSS